MYSTEFTVKILVKHQSTPPIEMIKGLLMVPAVEQVEIENISTDYKLRSFPLPRREDQFQYGGDNWAIKYE